MANNMPTFYFDLFITIFCFVIECDRGLGMGDRGKGNGANDHGQGLNPGGCDQDYSIWYALYPATASPVFISL